ncbi:polysaccharide export outer membrane protein [Flexibacter flexilis DSM 6793]|uniref:Polysaccharide export outer membrane protein n=1 Tax=Flexibacter flexilis DSM 6793 TaxID=927664 RepID=A0A1I1M3H3_9BACT|nr:polysaccharide biosynthesis/export family protein [Flexibacter flexilis]SFC77143.1 polysaccharide export outer membrane protein [Flexibacter flexilis DSM 6793]
MIKNLQTAFCFCLFVCLSVSCIPRKSYIYLQSKVKPEPDSVFLKVEKQKYLVRPGDILYITVLCPDQEAVALFNIESARNSTTGNSSSNMGAGGGYFSGYIINDSGEIRMPMIGKINVQGLPLDSIDARISRKLSLYLNDVIVKVRLYSFKITVLGDVKNPGVQNVMAERFTILEAIGNANDLTDYGDRKRIELLRATPDGYMVHKIDLTDQDLVKSPYFFMAPNDILYVKPITAKMVRLNYPVYGYITTGVSAILLALSLFNRFSN